MCSESVTSRVEDDVDDDEEEEEENDMQQNDAFCKKHSIVAVRENFEEELTCTFLVAVPTCKRIEFQKVYQDPTTGCRSRKHVTHRECMGGCEADSPRDNLLNAFGGGRAVQRGRRQSCCVPKKVKPRRVRVFCADGTSTIVMMPVVRKCGCKQCPADGV